MTTVKLGEQIITLDSSSGIQDYCHATEAIGSYIRTKVGVVRNYTGPDRGKHILEFRAEFQRLMLVHSVLRNILRYHKGMLHNCKREDVVKITNPLLDAIDIINNQ